MGTGTYDSASPRSKTVEEGSAPADTRAVEEFLHLLARAVRQLRMYPPTSPLCLDAVQACHKSLVTIDRDPLALRVTPHGLLLDEHPIASSLTGVEQELARRLHRARVSALSVERAATGRDLLRFCADLVRLGDRSEPDVALSEMLTEHGVDKIAVSEVLRPEVLPVGAPDPQLCHLVEHERARREQSVARGPVGHLYPAGKGWVRLDPSARFDQISLADLAILVQDPAELAAMLMRLTDDELPTEDAQAKALEQKFGDVAAVLATLDPSLARIMFARLARTVLNLDPERRTALLRRTILPGLLDGRVDGDVLRDFPDLDLADSLILLLDFETAAPEVLATALDRLNLTAERHGAVVPLLEARLRDRAPRATAREGNADEYARRLLRVKHHEDKSFAEFAAFDLAMDEEVLASLEDLRDGMAATDATSEQLMCLWRLMRLEPNPTLVEGFLDRALAAFEVVERDGRWQDLVGWIDRYRKTAEALRQTRPDVADAITGRLTAFCTTARALQIARLFEAGAEDRALAERFVTAIGDGIAPSLVAALGDHGAEREKLVALMCHHARLLAPAIVEHVKKADAAIVPSLIRVLGHAGAGHEASIAEHLRRPDEQPVREAYRALARIGSARAAALVSARIEEEQGWRQTAAEEALWRFPAAEASRQCAQLLGRRDFVLRHPKAAGRLLDRAVQTRAQGLRSALAALAPLRFRFWNPPLMRVALKARAILAAP